MIAFFVIFGAATLPLGAQMTVRGATELAAQTGAAEAAIGATIIALGTSLPELVVSIMAVAHRQIDMAIGNALGSNVLNILVVVGATSRACLPSTICGQPPACTRVGASKQSSNQRWVAS